MSSWIILVGTDYPQHWAIAKEHGFWDMTMNHPVHLGDTIYFWQAGGSLLAQCEATSPHYPISPAMELPWDDSADGRYVARFTLRVLSEAPNAQPSWGEVRRLMGNDRLPLQLREIKTPEAETVLASYFSTEPVGTSYGDEEREREMARLGYDLRKFSYRAIAQRQGQPAFRNALLKAYEGRCAVTGTQVESVLEAAHLASYKGTHSNRVYNGLLLRADIHTLLDLHRVTVTPDFVIRVDSALGEPYRSLDGTTIAFPEDDALRPDAQLLLEHNRECDWFSG